MLKAHEPSGQLLFEEKEKFPQWILILILIVTTSSVLITLVSSFAVGYKSASGTSDAWIALTLVVSLEAVMVYLFYMVRFEKVVTSNGLYFRWLPIQKRYRVIEKNSIEKVEHRKAPFHYGAGWDPGYGKVHNLDKQGLQLYLVSGKKIFFGSGETDNFKAAMDQLLALKSKTSPREF